MQAHTSLAPAIRMKAQNKNRTVEREGHATAALRVYTSNSKKPHPPTHAATLPIKKRFPFFLSDDKHCNSQSPSKRKSCIILKIKIKTQNGKEGRKEGGEGLRERQRRKREPRQNLKCNLEIQSPLVTVYQKKGGVFGDKLSGGGGGKCQSGEFSFFDLLPPHPLSRLGGQWGAQPVYFPEGVAESIDSAGGFFFFAFFLKSWLY